MLSEICRYLRNWFETEKYFGTFNIHNGELTCEDGSALPILDGQYFRIIGSVFNDGIFCKPPTTAEPSGELKDETFEGAVWALAIPREIIALSAEIDDWQAKYGGAESAANSPYSSESFAGYSYSKSGGSASDGAQGASPGDWCSVYGSRLKDWRKI